VIYQIILLQKISTFRAKLTNGPLKFQLNIVKNKIRQKQVTSVFRHAHNIKISKLKTHSGKSSACKANRGFSMALFCLVFFFVTTNRHKNKGEQEHRMTSAKSKLPTIKSFFKKYVSRLTVRNPDLL